MSADQGLWVRPPFPHLKQYERQIEIKDAIPIFDARFQNTIASILTIDYRYNYGARTASCNVNSGVRR